MIYRVGQTWVRDGKTRTIVRIMLRDMEVQEATVDQGFDLVWVRKPGASERVCWCTTWSEWANRATLKEQP